MKTTDGCFVAATANKARTIFSPSPIHFEVKLDALMLKKVEFDCDAIHLPIKVFPVPGGPNCLECTQTYEFEKCKKNVKIEAIYSRVKHHAVVAEVQ